MNSAPTRRRFWFFVLFAFAALAIVIATILLAEPRSRGLLVNTLQLAAGAVLIAAPAGALLGLIIARTDAWGRRPAMVLLGGMLFVPLYLTAAAWQAGFGIEGWQTSLQSGEIRTPWLDGFRGAIWVHGCAGIPWVALFVGLASRSIPRGWEETALFDLSMAGVFVHVTLRFALPAVFLGALWVAITTMTEMSVTDLFAVRTYAEELYIELNLGSWNAVMGSGPAEIGNAPALPGVVVTLISAISALMLARAMMVVPQRTLGGRAHLQSLGTWRIWGSLAMWIVVGVVVLLPLCSLVYKAGAFVVASQDGLERGWSIGKAIRVTASSPAEHTNEFRWSAAMAGATAGLTLLCAIPLGYASRTSKLAGGLGLALAVAGLALPGPIVGLGLIKLFNSSSWPWMNYVYDHTVAAPVLAQTWRAFPLTFFLVWHALRTIPAWVFEAAQLDGAGRLGRLWLAVRHKASAISLAGFAAAVVSLGELAATILVVPPGIEPLSVRVFGLLHYNVEDQLAAISLMLILMHAVAAWAILAMGRRAFRIG